MKIDRGLLATLGAAAVTAACAGAGAGGGGPRVTVPPPDVVCSTGIVAASPIADSAAARLALIETVPDSLQNAEYLAARQQAGRAITAEPENAYGYYLAGQAALNLGDPVDADTLFDRAVAICPEMAAYDIDRLRTAGAALTYNRGLGLLQAQDTMGAVRAWESAVALDPNSADAEFYLGLVDYTRQQTEGAARHWRRVVEILDALPADTSAAVMTDRADTRANTYNALTAAAIQYLQRDMMEPAAALLGELGEMMPNNADVWYHYALALNNLQRWRDLVAAGERAVELAPLHYGAWTLYYNGFAGQAQAASDADQRAQADEFTRQAREISRQAEALPVSVQSVRVDTEGSTATVRGQVLGSGGTSPITVELTLHGVDGPVGTGSTTVTPPAEGQATTFEVSVPVSAPVAGWSYRQTGG